MARGRRRRLWGRKWPIGTGLVIGTVVGVVAGMVLPAAAASDPPVVTVGGRQMENLDRGVVAVRSGNGNLVTWRLLGTDPSGTAFNLYRGDSKITSTPVTGRPTISTRVRQPTRVTRCGPCGTAPNRRRPCRRSPSRAATWTFRSRSPAASTPRTTPRSVTSTATASTRSCSSGIRPTPRTTRSPASPATFTSTPIELTVNGCGGSTSAATSARAPTTRSSRCTTSTATAGPRSR